MNTDRGFEINHFDFYSPTKILFGVGRIIEIGNVVKPLGDRVLLVTGRIAMRKTGILGQVVDKLTASGVETTVYEGISRNPRATEVDEGVNLFNRSECQVIIGLGGGSAMDAAKAISVVSRSGGCVKQYLTGAKQPTTAFPVVAIPTTAGTGSELSKGAIISEPSQHLKKGIRGEALLPKVAVIDPRLTLTLPPHITAETGFDVFAHAVESYISRKASPITELFSLKALSIVSKYLERVYNAGDDLEARSQMAFASMLMGFNLGNATTCLPHRMQYPVGAHTDTSHQIGLAALYPAWVERTYPHSPEKFGRIVQILSPELSELPLEEASNHSVEAITRFMAKLNLTVRLRDLGIQFEDCEKMANEVTGNVAVDPGDVSQAGIVSFYKAAY